MCSFQNKTLYLEIALIQASSYHLSHAQETEKHHILSTKFAGCWGDFCKGTSLVPYFLFCFFYFFEPDPWLLLI